MKKIFPLICLAAMFIPGISFASGDSDGFHGVKNPEVKKYVSEKVMPVLYEKRQLLENELTPTEKSEIAECRTALGLLRAQEHKIWQQRRAEKQSEGNATAAPNSSDKEAFAEIRKQRQEIMQRLQKVADMHSTTLSGIRAQLEPLHKQWTDDLTQIRAAAHTDQTKEYRHSGLPQFSLTGHYATSFFLLMELQSGKSLSGELKSDPISASTTLAAVSLSSFSVRPNPASTEIVTGNDPLPAINELALYDIQGKKVLSVENVQSAQHIDINNLPAGSYVIRLTSGGQTASRQVVIAH